MNCLKTSLRGVELLMTLVSCRTLPSDKLFRKPLFYSVADLHLPKSERTKKRVKKCKGARCAKKHSIAFLCILFLLRVANFVTRTESKFSSSLSAFLMSDSCLFLCFQVSLLSHNLRLCFFSTNP
jgi:hypothetical protein